MPKDYLYVVGTKDQETRTSERFEYVNLPGPFANSPAVQAYVKAKAEADKMRAEGYRCKIYHKPKILIDWDEE
jgi:hypothetical protein